MRILIPIIILGLASFFIYQKVTSSSPIKQITTNVEKSNKILSEKIPGSKFHSPDATWWGYNQNKIVRFGDLVFMYVVENLDDSNKTLSNLVIYLKNGDSSWQKGASFATSRPGNILVDSQGVLHT